MVNMMDKRGLLMLLLIGFGCVLVVKTCNEAICASIVSKCMLTQSCKCDLKNMTCGKDCFHCLDYLYTDCCSCVEMCPKPNETESRLSQKSNVEDLPEPMADLFNLLTEEKDRLLRWISFTYPTRIGIVSSPADTTTGSNTVKEEVDEDRGNCTVAFMSFCMSLAKCKNSCRSMGASSYRWFHDGCCECVGNTCINYGINQSKCRQCPLDRTEFPEELEVLKENDLIKEEENYNKNI